uniref:ATP synthase subunit a n=1 Tax=Sphenodon punctatus TaxID=8508 RepID=A0A0F7LF10_SPHPU|nr:ATP synthase F0 subunit 6 [Sphenodon punctatus]
MIPNLFEIFATPYLLKMPLMWLAVMMPAMVLFTPSQHLVTGRYILLKKWTMKQFTKQIMSPLPTQGHKWTVFFMTLMMTLTSMNMISLLPHTFTPTAQLALTLALAFPLWLATVIIGVLKKTTRSLAHFLPEGSPTILIPALVVVETISLLIRPLALGVRLAANLTAGHLLLQLMALAIIHLPTPMWPATVAVATTLMLLTILEVAVALIQAYVFVLLLSLYLQENI